MPLSAARWDTAPFGAVPHPGLIARKPAFDFRAGLSNVKTCSRELVPSIHLVVSRTLSVADGSGFSVVSLFIFRIPHWLRAE